MTNFEPYDRWTSELAFGTLFDLNDENAALARRKRELCMLLHKVIRNELSEQDRLLVRLHWYQNKSKNEIAALIGLDRSSVYRRFEKINDVIYEKLKYAMEYRFDDGFSQAANGLGQQTLQTALRRGPRGESPLSALRRGRGFSRQELAALLPMEEKRLYAIEQNADDMTVRELRTMMCFFGISADGLLFADRERG